MYRIIFILATTLGLAAISHAQTPTSLVQTHLRALSSANSDGVTQSFNIGMPPTAKAWIRDSLIWYKQTHMRRLGKHEIQKPVDLQVGGKNYQAIFVNMGSPISYRLPYDLMSTRKLKAVFEKTGLSGNPAHYMGFLVAQQKGKPFLIFPTATLRKQCSR